MILIYAVNGNRLKNEKSFLMLALAFLSSSSVASMLINWPRVSRWASETNSFFWRHKRCTSSSRRSVADFCHQPTLKETAHYHCHYLNSFSGWLGGVVVRASDSWSRGREFDLQPRHYQVATLGKVAHTRVPLSPSSIIWYRCKSRGGNGRLWKRCGLPSIMPGVSPLPAQDRGKGD